MLGFEKQANCKYEPNENREEGNGPPTYGRKKLQTVGIDTLNEPTNETGRARRMETAGPPAWKPPNQPWGAATTTTHA